MKKNILYALLAIIVVSLCIAGLMVTDDKLDANRQTELKHSYNKGFDAGYAEGYTVGTVELTEEVQEMSSRLEEMEETWDSQEQ